MFEVLATDLDGTLFYPKKRLTLIAKKNLALLKKMHERGGRVVLVTSRSEVFLKKLDERLGFPVDVIGTDGTFVRIDGNVVRNVVFDPEPFRAFVADIRKEYDPGLLLLTTRQHPIVMTKTRVSKFTNFVYFIYELSQGAYRDSYIRSDQFFYSEIQKGQVSKLMVLIGLTKKKQKQAEKICEDLKAKYPDYEFAWLNQFIEITPKGCSKASGLAFYLDYLGINHDNVVVVGDSGNDVPMFEAFHENSYCMKHSPASVRAKAKHTIPHVYDLEPLLCPSEDSNPS